MGSVTIWQRIKDLFGGADSAVTKAVEHAHALVSEAVDRARAEVTHDLENLSPAEIAAAEKAFTVVERELAVLFTTGVG
jgi:hypothetical protein